AVVQEGLARKIFYRKEEGAIAVDLANYGLGEKILLRNDGTALYITQDLGTADLRYTDYPFDKMIYVVGDEQAYHFKVLFAIVETLGRPYAASVSHLSYGMVNLPHGKMKSREGTIVDADQLVAEMVQTVKSYTEDAQKIE
ncbi:MAG: arginine--tRNA ligase, partial [Candidatus Cardinium sp.]|nr:arginine--tRNA ligase [Candidatus Cardinium sp.]